MSKRIQIPMLLALGVTLFLSAPAAALGAEKPAKTPVDEAGAVMLARDYASAVKILTKYLEGKPKRADQALFLLAKAHDLAGQDDEAISALDRLAGEHSKSP
ncbi:MAG: tetratricopeptide repeat protein, partial [Planctomycetota bacterium]